MDAALPLDALEALAASGARASLFDGPPALCVALCVHDPAPSARARRWLHDAACPLIGIGDARAPLAAHLDVVVDDAASAQALLTRIHAAPRAAAIAVQVLRHAGGLELDAALLVESLAYSTLQAGPEFRAWLSSRTPAPRMHDDTGAAVCVDEQPAHWHLRLNRPASRNAMSVEMRDALLDALARVAVDAQARPLHLDAAGACFSTGGDLAEFGSAPDPASAHLVRSLALPGRALARLGARATVVVHGACIGSGIEFPAFAARVVARPDVWFQLPELRFGLIPGAGGCVSVARRIGRQRCAWMILSGRRIDARTALAWGLVDAIEAAA